MLIIRQIALAVRDIEAAEKFLTKFLGLEVCYRDPDLRAFGLVNIVLPVGSQFLEVVSPVENGTTAGRFLDKNGDGGYMVITQCDDYSFYRGQVETLGVRIAHEFEIEKFLNMQLHPKDTGGSFLEIDQQLGIKGNEIDGPWAPVGEMGVASCNNSELMAIKSVGIVSKNASEVAKKWSAIFEKKYTKEANDFLIKLDNSTIRFSSQEDVSHDRLASLELSVGNKQKVLDRAKSFSLRCSDISFFALGIEWYLSGD